MSEKRYPGSNRPRAAQNKPYSNAKKPGSVSRPVVAPARRVALSALCDVTMTGAYAGLALDKRLTESALSLPDRRLATTLFYTALENRLRIEYTLGQFIEHMPEPIAREILHLAATQLLFLDKIPDHAAVDDAVKQIKALGRDHLSPLVNGTLRNLIRARDAGSLQLPDRETNPIRYLSIVYSLSEPLLKRIIEAYGPEEAERIISYHPEERCETVRPNLLEMDDAAFLTYMEKRGYEIAPGEVQHTYYIHRAGDLTGEPDYKRGVYSVQGASSVLAALAVEPRPGMNILDACAAPGGKSAVLCEIMQNTGRVYAYDLHEHRVALIKALAQRLKLYNLRAVMADATVFRSENEEAMDAVLVDAPCSGLGVMHNKPDIKYRLKDQSIDEIIATQGKILETCARYVKPGGLLVYSTCTILPEENEEQVNAFLAAHPDFSPETDSAYLPECYRPLANRGMIQFQAYRDVGMDGFFIARLRKNRRRP